MREDIVIGYTSGENKEFTFDIDNKTIELLTSLNKPSQLLRKGGNMGVKGITTFFVTTLLFAFINIAVLIYAFVLAAVSDETTFYVPLAVLVSGIVFMYFSITKTYGYIFVNILKTIYIDCRAIVKKICYSITDKVADELDKKKGPDLFLTKSINLYGILDDNLKSIPSIAKKGLWFLLKRIPFVKYIDNDIVPLLVKGSRKEASELLYTKTDNFIINDIFGSNTLGWLLWMIPLNIVVQIVIILLEL
jgi:hypothetical protein